MDPHSQEGPSILLPELSTLISARTLVENAAQTIVNVEFDDNRYQTEGNPHENEKTSE